MLNFYEYTYTLHNFLFGMKSYFSFVGQIKPYTMFVEVSIHVTFINSFVYTPTFVHVRIKVITWHCYVFVQFKCYIMHTWLMCIACRVLGWQIQIIYLLYFRLHIIFFISNSHIVPVSQKAINDQSKQTQTSTNSIYIVMLCGAMLLKDIEKPVIRNINPSNFSLILYGARERIQTPM